MMTLDDIEIFVKVVEHKSFSMAAALLRLPKSALPYVREGKLIEILQGSTLSFAEIYAVYPSRKFISPNVRAFIDFIKPRFAI